MIAKYVPKGEHFGYLDRCIGFEYEFEFLSVVDKVMIFKSVDKNFGSAGPIPETDLEFQEPFGESVYRMANAGWEVYTGKEPPPDSMKTYEFCIMDDFTFKKLRKTD